MPNVAVVYICTGRYSRFFEGFYESAKQHLLKGVSEVEYFVFTDDEHLPQAPDIHYIQRHCQGFPADTLMRFEMFLGVREQLKMFDYVCFINSNAEIRSDVGQEIFPHDDRVMAVRWIGQKPFDGAIFYPYERNRRSTAYVKPFDKPYAYYMGGFYCAKAMVFLNMAEELAMNIRMDVQKGILARHNDESHLNCYLHNHEHDVLPKGYCCAEERLSEAFETKIVFRNKVIYDPYFDKGRDHTVGGRIMHGAKTLWLALKWYII